MTARRSTSHAFAFGLAVLVCACVPTLVHGRVSSALYASPPLRASFSVVGPDGPSTALSERQIQTLIAGQMVSLGFAHASSPDSADLAVLYSYSIGSATTQLSSAPDPVFGGQKVASQTQYPRSFQVTIVEQRPSVPPDQRKVLWKGELFSAGSSADIGEMSLHFVPEIFRSFGKSETNRRFRRVMR
jgi:hypothetical protein